MYEGLEFRHLVAFVAVVEECSFVKAAERLKISQPALSYQIKQLEEGLGVGLLIRSQTGVYLTDYGRHFLCLARQILHMKDHAVRTTSVDKSRTELPLRFGYSPFTDHILVEEARIGYLEMVPGGHMQTSSECSAELTKMVADGRLDVALVSLPLTEKNLFMHRICKESVLVCLRRDDPLANAATLPQSVIENRLSILFARVHQPELYDELMRKLKGVGIDLHPSEFFSSPSAMQYMVKSSSSFGLAQESSQLDPELKLMRVEGVDLTVTTGLICRVAQMSPVLPMLAYRIEKRCAGPLKLVARKRPNGRVGADDWNPVKRAS